MEFILTYGGKSFKIDCNEHDGTGHLPLFRGYAGDGLLGGCGAGGVFQFPSAEQIYNVSPKVEAGAGILYLYGNYTGDIMNFEMASEMCEMDDIETRSTVDADDVNSGKASSIGVAGIFFNKCAGVKAAAGGNLDEVCPAGQGQRPRRWLCTDALRDPQGGTPKLYAG